LSEFAEETTKTVNVSQPEILFVIQGDGRVAMTDANVCRTLKQGDFVFLPAGIRLMCEFASGTAILSVRVIDHPECYSLRIKKADECPEEAQELYVLKANKHLWHFIRGVQQALADGLQCGLYMQAEAFRMQFFLYTYYSIRERVLFFFHSNQVPDVKFSEFVQANYMKYKTVGEMAAAFFMTSQAFSSRFKKVFGTTPYQWMQREKARNIYQDICRDDLSFKEIAIKYNFSLSSHFFRFCKQTFGESPGNIRKGVREMRPTRNTEHESALYGPLGTVSGHEDVQHRENLIREVGYRAVAGQSGMDRQPVKE
jgi:AraC-like DNA-binding protein